MTATQSLWSTVVHRKPRANPAPAFSREQLVGQIIAMNPSATATFLERFAPEALTRYLDHLTAAATPRGSSWIRPGDTPAVVSSSRQH